MITALLLLRALSPLSAGTLTVDTGDLGPVEIVWEGCKDERAGPICVTKKDEEIVVWTRLEPPVACERHAPMLAGSGFRTLDTVAVDGGCRTRVKVEDAGAGVLELRAGDRVIWSMPLEQKPPRHRAVEEAVTRANGDPTGALRHLAAELPHVALAGDELVFADALDTHARLAFISGSFADGVTSAEHARALYMMAGRFGAACDVSELVAQRAWQLRRDHDAVATSLRALLPCVAVFPRFALIYRLMRAQIFRTTGSGGPHATWVAYRDLDVLARRVRDHDSESSILSVQYDLAQQLQLREEAQRIDRRMTELYTELEGRIPCGLGVALNNTAWTTLLRHERGEAIPDLRQRLEELRGLFAAGRCTDRRNFRQATIHLALAYLQHGEYSLAEMMLLHVNDSPQDPEGTLWQHLILARAGLESANLKLAAAHTDALTELERGLVDPFFAWHAAHTRGRLAEARGELDAAIAEYTTAEALREDMALPMAFGATRERLVVDLDASLHGLVRLLLARDDRNTALRVVRLARRRALRSVLALASLSDEPRARLAAETTRHRDAAELAIRASRRRVGSVLDRARVERRRERLELRRRFDEAVGAGLVSSPKLREPEAGELLLVFHPFGDRWLTFADDGSSVTFGTVDVTPDMTDEQLGAALYDPFADAIADAREIRLLAYGALGARDLHGLPFRGQPLFAHAPVVYSLDLDDTAIGDPLAVPQPISLGVVVAADPGGEAPRLLAVSKEAIAVENSMHDLDLYTQRLHGDKATRSAALAALAGADVLHFSGHNLTPREAKGSDNAWDRELLLERDTSFGVEEVLLAPSTSVPRIVVLSACETGKTDPRAASGGVGIGQAFLTRGTELVVATSRLVDDATAAHVAAEFYAEAPGIADLADPRTLAAAQTELLGDAPCAEHRDVCAYQAWVR